MVMLKISPQYLFARLRAFYGSDCCWPYSVSFYLVLVIFWLDFFFADTPYHFASLAAYGIIFAYYLQNSRLYLLGRIIATDTGFFIRFLSFKIAVWAAVLGGLYLLEMSGRI